MTQVVKSSEDTTDIDAGLAINSRGWWDQYFEQTWEMNRGRNQTRGFMRALIANLPDNELAYMLSNTASVLDWGCAMGDGVQILGESFPQARVAGLDFAIRAIDTAREAYPQFEFIQTDDGSIPSSYDVIITSNCLEHFANPLDMARQHLLSCNYLYVAMVPYNEQELLDQHQARFKEETFPENLGEFVRIMAQPIDLPDMYWPGQQLIAVYGSPSYLQRRSHVSLSPDLMRQIAQLRLNLLAADASLLGKQGVEAEEKIHDLWQLAQEKDRAIQEKDSAIAELRYLHSTVLDALRDAERKAAEQRQRQEEITSHIEQVMSEQLAQTRHALAAANTERAELISQLNVVYNSKAWRWSVKYWRWRSQGLKGVVLMGLTAIKLILLFPFWVFYHVIHAFYHVIVPRKLRVAFWEYRWRRRHGDDTAAQRAAARTLPGGALTTDGVQVGSRDLKNIRDVYIFAMVPFYDIGGGQRSAQLAKTFNRMGCAVHYVYAYDSTDAGERDPFTPTVRHLHVNSLTPRDVVSSLIGEALFIFEAPHKDFELYLDLAEKIHAKVVYEHIDNWETSLGSFFFREDIYRKFLRRSDVLVATTQLLAERMIAYMRNDSELAYRADQVIYAANAVDTDLFDPQLEQTRPEDLVLGSPTMLYYGSLWGEWFRWDLIRDMAQQCPSCSINLIGDYKPIEAMVASLPANVHFLGPKKQTELPAYLAHSDIALLPFKNDDIGKYVSPLKIFEYIAMDKPVLATALPDIQGYPNVFTSDDARDWLRVARGEEVIVTSGAYEFATANSWYARCNRLLDEIEPLAVDAIPGRSISVAVLNRNNGKVITRCIDSLLQARDRYGYEIIVVDNDSTDGSYEMLGDRYGERITLLRNSKNGCSSGRNLAIKHAHGNVLLFVDSDQWVVSKRWLDAPLSVLAQNRSIGAVGWSGGWFHRDSIGGPITADLPHGGIHPKKMFRTDIGYLATSGMLVRREVLNGLNTFDEAYDPTCYEDTDVSLQIRDQGYELAYCPYMNLNHLPHQTTQAGSNQHLALMKRNGMYFTGKWKARNPKLLEYYLN